MLIFFLRRLRSRHNRVSCHGKVRIVRLSGSIRENWLRFRRLHWTQTAEQHAIALVGTAAVLHRHHATLESVSSYANQLPIYSTFSIPQSPKVPPRQGYSL